MGTYSYRLTRKSIRLQVNDHVTVDAFIVKYAYKPYCGLFDQQPAEWLRLDGIARRAWEGHDSPKWVVYCDGDLLDQASVYFCPEGCQSVFTDGNGEFPSRGAWCVGFLQRVKGNTYEIVNHLEKYSQYDGSGNLVPKERLVMADWDFLNSIN